MIDLTVEEIRERLKGADEKAFEVLSRSLEGDTRKGVRDALKAAKKRISQQAAERGRLDNLYSYEAQISHGASVIVGLDEVGRGPLAGPLAVGAVVLDHSKRIEGLNDSKQLTAAKRQDIAKEIEKSAQAFCVVMSEPEEIDEIGIMGALRKCFSGALQQVEGQIGSVDAVLIDGNPLHIDPREINIVKGDSLCASISAASIIAKVKRDAIMIQYDSVYPGYGFASHKGYGTAEHRDAIQKLGLSPLHRRSFCSEFLGRELQDSLF
ncbi:MAG: ribonuclease HII [Eggerthellaceae bacterium]|nr:ribonuclease HII [Eggerthellaceae bacterium]